ncbi:phosphopantetheine-binding protein [Corynebacterium sp.]|uniref:phosphopantetheine-binding protein n=1 Tax=Corynebacterium sp. TaxID=1720 RepID=UPI0027BA6CD5|nr:phosphopantetheine-binding protein [Corynebacterium sp.]
MSQPIMTLERLRSDIAQVLDCEPDSLADDVALTDQGMDSIRLVTLAESWRIAGYNVNFHTLFEQPFLHQWLAAFEEN